MIKTTKEKKTKSVPKELPPGWEFVSGTNGHQAFNRESNLQTHILSMPEYAIEAAHEIEAAKKEGLLGLAGKGLVSRDPEVNGDGFQPGFPPGFDPKKAEKGLAQSADTASERLHEEALARWRDRRAPSDDDSSNGYHPQLLHLIPLDRVVPSQTNPRKYFDPVKLQELADSIQEHGLAQPILVRPTTLVPIEGGEYDDESFETKYYEIVAGERRWRAAKLAGLTVIEAKVRDLDDKAVLEIQFIENLQRADLSAIEEAEGYKRLLDEHGYTADSLAGKLGKSKSYVYGRLKLCNLPAAALDALAKGDLPATVGELIGRLPGMEMREQFWEENYWNLGSEWFDMPSFRDVKETIERKYMRELKSAPFSQADKKLLPEAGSCKDCPKRTGNNRVEYPDGRADMCTDVRCYGRKVDAHVARESEKAKAAGAKVLSSSQTKKIFNGGRGDWWLSFEAGKKYVKLDDKCPEDKEGRGYAELLGDDFKPVVAIDPNGKSHLLAPREEAEKVLKEQHKIKLGSVTTASDSYKASEKKRKEERELRQATAAEIVTRVLLDVDDELFNSTKFLRQVAKALIHVTDTDIGEIAKRRGIEYDAKKGRFLDEGMVDKLDDADIPGFIVELLLLDELESWASWGSEHVKFLLCDYFGLKPKAVMKEVSGKLKEAKKKPKAKAGADAKA